MEELRRFQIFTEFTPGPGFAAPFILDGHVIVLDAQGKMIFESGVAPVNGSWQPKPKHKHHAEPK